MTTLGMHCVFGAPLGSEPERLERIATLAVDPRWRAGFKTITVGRVPGSPVEPLPRGRIAAKDLARVVREALLAATAQYIELAMGKTAATDLARLYINTGRYDRHPGWANARWELPRVDSEPAARDWVELQHAIVEAVGAQHGVIVVTPNFEITQIEIWAQNVTRDGRPVHPRPEEISSYSVAKRELGDKYLRAPRWGTYLSPRHLDAIGGRQRVLDVVQPPVVREIGTLVYFQMSERVADALSAATEAKRAAFEQLVAPLMPPRREN